MNRQRVGQTYTDYLRKSSAKLAIFKFRAYHSSATWRVPSTSVIALKDNSFFFLCALCG